MADYDALKTKLSTAVPTGTSSDAYTPTNSPAACPAIGDSWVANGNNLPPTPDSNLCNCMFSTLSCVPQPNLNTSSYGDIFNYVCTNDPAACAGILTNTSTGVYGPYSMCNSTQQLGVVLDAYYKNQKSASTACDFQGAAEIVKPVGAASSCSASLASASSAVNNAATATSASGPGAAKSSSLAAAIPMKNLLSIGDMAVGMYVVVAMGVGAGMVLL